MSVIIFFLSFMILVGCATVDLRSVSVEEFEKHLYETKAEQLIDIRTPEEFAKYHIVSAKNIDIRSVNFKREIEKLDKSKPVLIYCLSGKRSKAAMPIFQDAGFVSVYELNEGINGWMRAKKAIFEDLSGIGELKSEDFNAIVNRDGYVLVDFYAPWCAPCQKMLPMLKELEATNKNSFRLLTINFDQNRLLTKEMGIFAVPYLIIYRNGEKIWEKQGEATIEELKKMLEIR